MSLQVNCIRLRTAYPQIISLPKINRDSKTMYSKKKLDAYYFTTKGFYAFFIPVRVPYKQIYPMADSAGVKKKETFGPIMESGKSFGFGWIGVEIEKPSQPRNDVKNVTGEFETYEHKGAYKTLGKAYRKIMKERPSADDVTSIRHAYLLKILIQRKKIYKLLKSRDRKQAV